MAVDIKTEVVFPEDSDDNDSDRRNIGIDETIFVTKTEVVEESQDVSILKNENQIFIKEEEEISVSFVSEDSADCDVFKNEIQNPTKCMQLSCIFDVEVPIGTNDRAKKTIPKSILELKPSAGSVGIFAWKTIPVGVQFGPQEGVTAIQALNWFIWRVRYGKLMDVDVEKNTNWLRYINCAKMPGTQNLVAFQNNGKLYYQSLREIKVGEELLVDYVAGCSQNLGVNAIYYFQPHIKDISQSIHRCIPCCFGFSEENSLINHNMTCPYKDKELGALNNPAEKSVCEICKTEHDGYCPNLIQLQRVFNRDIKIGVENRAKKTIPKSILKYKSSGVFALKNIPPGVQFGPYEGVTAFQVATLFVWRVKYGKLIDVDNEENTNWLRYINCTKQSGTQNLVAFQSDNKIYYRSLQEIKTGEELLVDYGVGYAKNLDVEAIYYFQPHIEELKQNTHRCFPCCFGFSEQRFLIDHTMICPYRRKNLNSNAEIFVCSFCKLHLLDEAFYKRHVNICERKYIRNNPDYIMRKYKCSECNFSAKWKCHLDTHAVIHKNDKPFPCTFCEKTFKQRSGLLHHIQRHNQAKKKKFTCPHCKNTYYNQIALDSHINVKHLNRRNYQCSHCNKHYLHKVSLNRHIKTMHPKEKKYKCNSCEFATVRGSYLRKHILVKHPAKLNVPKRVTKEPL